MTEKSMKTQKQQSFLSRVVQRQSAKKQQPVTPSSQHIESDLEYKDCFGNPSAVRSSKPGIASRSGESPSTNGSRGTSPMMQNSSTIRIAHNQSTATVKLGCNTTTNRANREVLARAQFNQTQARMNPRDAYGVKESTVERSRANRTYQITNFSGRESSL